MGPRHRSGEALAKLTAWVTGYALRLSARASSFISLFVLFGYLLICLIVREVVGPFVTCIGKVGLQRTTPHHTTTNRTCERTYIIMLSFTERKGGVLASYVVVSFARALTLSVLDT